MSFWERFLYWLGARRDPGPRYYRLDAALHLALGDRAAQEGRPPEDLAAELITNGLHRRLSQDDLLLGWESLSPREQDVAALACLGYTNRQIAARLGVSAETIKTHLHNALLKFDLHGRAELRALFAAWDFSAWDRQP